MDQPLTSQTQYGGVNKMTTEKAQNKPPVRTCTCLRCAHTWHPRVEKPDECPGCKSRYWNVAPKIQ